MVLLSNLNAEVQLFATHGTVQSIMYKSAASSGIRVGTTYTMSNGQVMIGTDDEAQMAWSNSTKLVTYMTCNSGGENGNWTANSITYKTVSPGGADMAVGFKKVIYLPSAEQWSRNYNMWLASGYGVLDAIEYANSINYENNNVHSTFFVYSVDDPNEKIGRYATNTRAFSENIGIENSYLMNDYKNRNLIANAIDVGETKNLKNNIINIIEDCDIDFVNGDYEIVENETSIVDLKNNKEEKIKYITAVLKIGDFYTDSAYVVKIVDNRIEAIYNNTLEKSLIERAMNSKDLKTVTRDYIDKIADEYEKSYIKSTDEKIVIQKDNVKYFFDIVNNKKYVKVPVESIIRDSNKLINYIQYEI